MAACGVFEVAQQAAITGLQVSMVVLANHTQRRPAMARTETTPDARVLVGVDISKHRHEVLISVPGKQRRRRVILTNTKADFERLVGVLSGYGLPVRIGFEATAPATPALNVPGDWPSSISVM
jgi:hypothetical protein